MEALQGQDAAAPTMQAPFVQLASNTPINDETMGDAEENASIPSLGGYHNGQHSRPQTSQSADVPSSHGTFSSQAETDRFPSPQMSYQQHQQSNAPRPSSGLSNGADRYGSHSQTYQDQNQRSSHQAEAAKAQSSVVIKVGMVGDAQIGKTSLMVKYVEGSWDEDYIQTLGMLIRPIKNANSS